MLDRQGHIRLVDYGLCIEDVSPGNYVAKPHYVGTVGYLSPEVNFYIPTFALRAYLRFHHWFSLCERRIIFVYQNYNFFLNLITCIVELQLIFSKSHFALQSAVLECSRFNFNILLILEHVSSTKLKPLSSPLYEVRSTVWNTKECMVSVYCNDSICLSFYRRTSIFHMVDQSIGGLLES